MVPESSHRVGQQSVINNSKYLYSSSKSEVAVMAEEADEELLSLSEDARPPTPQKAAQEPRASFELGPTPQPDDVGGSRHYNNTRASRYEHREEKKKTKVDEELQALGLWEEDMTKEQKLELLKVVAMSKETAKMEEAVRNSHFSPSSSAEWFGSGAHAIAPSSPLSHTSPKQKVEEVTLECEEGVLPPSPEKLDAPGTLKRQPNNSPQAMYDDVDEGDEWYGGFRARQGDTGRGRQLYSSLQSRPVKAVYAMEHRVLLEWQKDIPELKDKRFQDVEVANADEARDNPWARALSALHTSQRVPLFCPPGSDPRDHAEAILESFAAFHASLREQQRDPTLPLRAWGTPVAVGNHAKGTLDAATSRRAGRGDASSSFEEFPPLSGKASNREARPPEKEERPPEKEGPPVERSPRPTSFAAAVASARPPLAGVAPSPPPQSWSPKRPREPEQAEVEEDDAEGCSVRPCRPPANPAKRRQSTKPSEPPPDHGTAQIGIPLPSNLQSGS
uniref:Uncharacterized protein n=1 Tax=Ixodes ricinus TaxID=34613 RepID=V5HYY2_IXORI